MGFQISALNIDQFSHLFGQDQEALARQGIRRIVVDNNPGFPCRVSLQDAEVGEKVLLMNYEHQPLPTPFRSSHAIFVREWASQAKPDRNEVPEMFRHRLLSVRAFDASGMMIDADVIDGERLESLIEYLLANKSTDNLHLHNARLGCYAALVERG
ncbi:MAG: DUF1203 domain-containing protein [Acidiferrobacterales bacterium]